MSVRLLANPADCEIIRTDAAAILLESGEDIWAFPTNWSDDQIWKALELANNSYKMGVSHGEISRAFEIRKALGMEL